MLVQYVTQGSVGHGFLIKIHHISINPTCKDWFNIDNKILTSPEHQSINCSWVITASIASRILIHFESDMINVSTYLLICITRSRLLFYIPHW